MSARILLVEDNPGDVMLVQLALERAGSDASLRVARDGDEALEILEATDPAELPDLVLLDLNLPRVDGRQVLSRLKQDDDLSAVPVVVLSSSDAPGDVCMAYRHYANSYVTKPVEMEDFFELIERLVAYWLGTVHRAVGCCARARGVGSR